MKARRLPLVLTLVGLLVIALLVGNASGSTEDAPASDATFTDSAAQVWFCPGLPAPFQNAAGRVTFANLGAEPAEVIVTALPDDGEIRTQRFNLPGHTTATKARNALGPPGSLTIEAFGPRVIVEEGVVLPTALESTACAEQTSAHWYFPAGVTVRGVAQTLIIDNPYAADAKVNVSFRSSSGVRRPERLQELDVARRSRTIVAVEGEVVREPTVATQVDATSGAIVAAMALTFTPDAGRPGLAYTLGAPDVAARWTFAGAVVNDDTPTFLSLLAAGDDDVTVDVEAIVSGRDRVASAVVDVVHDATVTVRIGRCPREAKVPCVAVPAGESYTLVVRTEEPDEGVVAQLMTRLSGDQGNRGAVTSFGATEPLPAWAFAGSWIRDEQTTELAIYNPEAGEAKVDVQIVRAGKVETPKRLQQVAVRPGGRVNVTVFDDDTMPKADAALVVRSNGRVFVERSIVANDELTRSTGVPAD
jgi:hypothetical protein